MQQPAFRQQLVYAVVAQLISFFVLRLLSVVLAIGPLWIIRLAMTLLLPDGSDLRIHALAALSSLIEFVDTTVNDGTPLLLLLSLRYLWPATLDGIFMDAIRTRDPALATMLEARPYTYDYWQELWQYLRRSVRRLRWLIPYKLATLLPFVGPLILMGLSFYMTRRTFGRRLALVYAVLTLLPGGRVYAVALMELALGSRQLARELLEPYFCRMAMDERMRRAWFRHRNAATFGFGVLAYLLMQHSWTNLLVFIVAQAAVVELVTTPETLSRKPKAA